VSSDQIVEVAISLLQTELLDSELVESVEIPDGLFTQPITGSCFSDFQVVGDVIPITAEAIGVALGGCAATAIPVSVPLIGPAN